MQGLKLGLNDAYNRLRRLLPSSAPDIVLPEHIFATPIWDVQINAPESEALSALAMMLGFDPSGLLDVYTGLLDGLQVACLLQHGTQLLLPLLDHSGETNRNL